MGGGKDPSFKENCSRGRLKKKEDSSGKEKREPSRSTSEKGGGKGANMAAQGGRGEVLSYRLIRKGGRALKDLLKRKDLIRAGRGVTKRKVAFANKRTRYLSEKKKKGRKRRYNAFEQEWKS